MKILRILKSKLALTLLMAATVMSFKSYAQQDALYSQYMFNTLAINPAYAGSRDVLSVTALGRYQWLDVTLDNKTGSLPTTYTFSIDMPIKNEKMGIGLQVFSDQIGIEKTAGAYLTYAYKVRIGPRTTMALGVQGGFTNFNIPLSTVFTTQSGDPAFLGQDISVFKPNVGGGIYLSNDRSYFGLSVPEILQYNLSNGTDPNAKPVPDSLKSKANYGFTRYRPYYAMMGFVIGLSNSLKLKPSMMVRYQQGAPLSIDGNMNLWIKDKIAFGVSYRFNQLKSTSNQPIFGDAVIGLFELQLTPQFRLGYAYDHPVNGLSSKSAGFGPQTHEVLLRYEFGYGKNKILTPRYF